MTSLADRARQLAAGIAERALETERGRQVPKKTIDELIECGLLRALQPARYGGGEADPRDFIEAVYEIASVCGSTGWVLPVLAVHSWQLALFPEQAQEEVWRDNPTALISSSYAPTGSVEAVPGGFELNGRWGFSSGCNACEWVMLGGVAPSADGSAVPDMRTFLLPKSDYEIDESSWHVAGLAGTGSKDIVVDRARVPEHRTLRFGSMLAGQSPGLAVHSGPLFRLPFATLFAYGIAIPIIGMARGAADAYLEMIRAKVGVFDRRQVALDPFAQGAYATATAEIDAVWARTLQVFDTVTRQVREGESVPVEERVAYRRDSAHAVTASLRAVDAVFESSGGRGLGLDNPLQRAWRNAHAGAVHAALNPHKAAQNFTSQRLGLPLVDPLV
jgi:3-hydroxy-9,10-secoandrosta-1,3,5(10)-triene-9,17-dione monooxygenase